MKVYEHENLILEMADFRSWSLTHIFVGHLNQAFTTDDFQGEEEKRLS